MKTDVGKKIMKTLLLPNAEIEQLTSIDWVHRVSHAKE
jgi:hypothetical protein